MDSPAAAAHVRGGLEDALPTCGGGRGSLREILAASPPFLSGV